MISIKKYKKALTEYKLLEKLQSRKIKGLKKIIKEQTKIIKKFEKENPYYGAFIKLNRKYTNLRKKVNQQQQDFTKIANLFRNVQNPFSKKLEIPAITYQLKQKNNKIITNNINDLTNIWLQNDLKPTSKFNNIKFLIKMSFENDNYLDLLDSDQWNQIKDDEAKHGGYNDGKGYISPLRLQFTLDNFRDMANSDPDFWNVSNDKIYRLTKKYLQQNDHELYSSLLEMEI